MTVIIPFETQTKLDQYFRFGQDVNQANLRYMMNRNAYGVLLTSGAINAAIGYSFDVIDDKGEILDWNDELHKVLDPNYKYVKLAGKYERGMSKAVLHWFDKGDKMVLRAFDPQKYQAEYDSLDEISKFSVIEYSVDGRQIEHTSTTEEELFYCYEIILRPTDIVGQGRVFYEGCFDELWGLDSLSENSVYFGIKHGSGMIYLEIPESKYNDPATKAKVDRFLRNFAPNGVYVVPKFDDLDPEFQPELKELQGTQIDFLSLRDLLLGGVSAATGWPREVVLGSELGLRSAETNQSAYFAILQGIQEDYRPVMRWLVNTICRSTEGLTDKEDSDFKIQYRKREVQDDDKDVAILKEKSEILDKLVRNNISLESILKLLDLEDLDIEEKEEVPMIPMMDPTNGDNTDDFRTDESNPKRPSESQIQAE